MLEPRWALRSLRTAASHACAVGRQWAAAIDAGNAEVGGQRARQQLNLARLQRQAMIRLRARRRSASSLPRTAGSRAFRPPARRELPRVAKMAGAAAEEIGVERHDDRRALDVVVHRHVGARGHAQAGGFVHLAARIPLMPHRGREARRESLRSVAASVGEADRLGENAKPGALGRLLRRRDRAHRADERRPRDNFSHVRQRSHAIGIVEIEQRRLREDVGRAEARRMRRDCLRFSSGVLRGFRPARPVARPPSVIAVA